MKYFVSIGERTVMVDLDGDAVLVDGQPMVAALESQVGSPEVRLVLDGRGAMLAVEGHGDGVWRLVDRGAVREVRVEDERSRHIRELAGPGDAPQRRRRDPGTDARDGGPNSGHYWRSSGRRGGVAGAGGNEDGKRNEVDRRWSRHRRQGDRPDRRSRRGRSSSNSARWLDARRYRG